MTMRSWADDQLDIIRGLHPDWDIWYVPRCTLRGQTWHAKPMGQPVATLSADSPDGISAKILGRAEPADTAPEVGQLYLVPPLTESA